MDGISLGSNGDIGLEINPVNDVRVVHNAGQRICVNTHNVGVLFAFLQYLPEVRRRQRLTAGDIDYVVMLFVQHLPNMPWL
jgi:hypothetical protein